MALLRSRSQARLASWSDLTVHDGAESGYLPDFLPDDDYGMFTREGAVRRWARGWIIPRHDRHLHTPRRLPSAAAALKHASVGLALTADRTHSETAAMAPGAAAASWVRSSHRYEIAKRILDVTGSAIGLVVLAPVFAAIAWLIKREDGGPVIHRRQVVGCGGRAMLAFKFRTMIVNADDFLRHHPALLAEYLANMKLHNDPRITRIGAILRRTSLDELPQLVNVLRGEMSLVGPRIIHPSERARYGDFAQVRQCVLPGITGLWQVSGRQEVSYAARVDLDRAYLQQRSFWFDLSILARTVGVVLRRYGAY